MAVQSRIKFASPYLMTSVKSLSTTNMLMIPTADQEEIINHKTVSITFSKYPLTIFSFPVLFPQFQEVAKSLECKLSFPIVENYKNKV